MLLHVYWDCWQYSVDLKSTFKHIKMKIYLLEVDKGIYYIFDPVVTKHAYTYTSIYSLLYHWKYFI